MQKKVLFQGDSITDAGRSRESDYYLGHGYASMVAGTIGYFMPLQYSFQNRSISGNRVVDLFARWKEDCINLSPDLVSILIGVNDVWHELEKGQGVDAKTFETVYDLLLSMTKEHLPNAKLVLLCPFVLDGSGTHEHFAIFQKEVALRASITKKMAEKHNAICISLQEVFDKACESAPADYWLHDGVHPTPAGHQLIATEWTKHVIF